MSTKIRSGSAVPAVLLTGLISLFVTAPAFAGDCPADKVGANALPGAATAPVGVTENELTSIDLSKESVNLPQRRLRFRHMEITPGGIVPPQSRGPSGTDHGESGQDLRVQQQMHGADSAPGGRNRA